MNLATQTYAVAPVWMQNIMMSVYGAHLRRIRYGKVHREILKRLRESQWLPAEEHRRRQLQRLNTLIREASSEVPFYRDRSLKGKALSGIEELTELQVLTKDEVQRAGKNLVSVRYAGGRLREIHTGGTTGKPLTVYCDLSSLQTNYAFFSRLREWAGIPPGVRVATFAGRTLIPSRGGPPYWRWNHASNTLLFSSYHIGPGTIGAYAEALSAFGPALIDSYPSSLEPLARYLLHRPDIRIRPRSIITSSETLFPETRQVIESAFGCQVFDHYGSAEMVALVTQCEAGSYHVNPEFGVLEVMKDGNPAKPGESGEIIATGFINPVMPLLRYATGDYAVMGTEVCSCGRAFPTIEHIVGRMDDVVITPEGYSVGRLDPIFKAVSSLYETRIVQDLPDHITVEVVVVGEFANAEKRVLMEGLRDRLGPSMRIDIVQVPSLERTRAGKLRTVVRKISSNTVCA